MNLPFLGQLPALTWSHCAVGKKTWAKDLTRTMDRVRRRPMGPVSTGGIPRNILYICIVYTYYIYNIYTYMYYSNDILYTYDYMIYNIVCSMLYVICYVLYVICYI